jgi:hypothetical protein
MKSAINNATLSNVPPLPPIPGARSTTFSSPNLSVYEAKLKFIPFFGTIPAGNPARVFDYPIGKAGIEELELETDCFYKIFNVKREKEIKLNTSSEYFILKADGSSMNIAEPVNIENEDYVLLHNTQEAKNNDIVAAVVFGQVELETATLKRYYLENGNRILRSESDKESINLTMSGKDYIQGVVVAILKPTDD